MASITEWIPPIKRFFLGRCCWANVLCCGLTFQIYWFITETKKPSFSEGSIYFGGILFYPKFFFHLRNIIQFFPGKQFYFNCFWRTIRKIKSFRNYLIFSSHVSIRSCFLVNRVAEF